MNSPLCPKCGKPVEFLLNPRAIHVGNRCFLTPTGCVCVPCHTAALEAQHGGSKSADRAKKGKQVESVTKKGPGLLARIGAWLAKVRPKAKDGAK